MRDLKIVCVEKANIERSGAVAQGLYAINCYTAPDSFYGCRRLRAEPWSPAP